MKKIIKIITGVSIVSLGIVGIKHFFGNIKK